MNIGAYLFKDGYDDVVRNAGQIADAAIADISRSPAAAREAVDRLESNASGLNYPGLSLVFVPATADPARIVRAGRWEHAAPPVTLPSWVARSPQGFTGTIGVPMPESPGRNELIVRAVRSARPGFVVVDVPIDSEMISRLHDATGVEGRIDQRRQRGSRPVGSDRRPVAADPGRAALRPEHGLLRQHRLGHRRSAPRHGRDDLPPRRALSTGWPGHSRRNSDPCRSAT